MRALIIFLSLILLLSSNILNAAAHIAIPEPDKIAPLISPLTADEHAATSQKVTVAITDYQPYIFWDKSRNTYDGISHDTLQFISKKTGIKFEYHTFESYSAALDAVKAGKVDVMFSVNQNVSIKKSDAYFTKKASLIVERTAKTRWADYFDSSDFTAAVIEGTGIDKVLNLKSTGHKIKYVHTPIEAIALVSFGDADYAVMDLAQFGYYQKRLDSHLLIPGDESQLLELATSFGYGPSVNKHVPTIFEKALASFTALETLYIESYWNKYKYVEPVMRVEFMAFLVLILAFALNNMIWAKVYKSKLKNQERMLNSKWLKAVNYTLQVERQSIRAQITRELSESNDKHIDTAS